MSGIDARARAILRENDRGGYTVPTSGLYPFQWNWDSAFAAWGFAAFDIDRAWTEIETLLAAQWETGMVPHIVFHRDDEGYFPGPEVWGAGRATPTSGITQPPVAASFVRELQEAEAAEARVADLWDRLDGWHRWFHAHRLDRGAVVVTHPWESGRDNAADWDSAMANVAASGVGEYRRRDTSHVNAEMRPRKEDYDRYVAILQAGRATGWDEARIAAEGPFRVADPGMTFILMRAERDLAALGRALGRDVAAVEARLKALEAGAETLWNAEAGHFDARDVRTGRFAGALTSAACLCWWAGLDDDRMIAPLDRLLAARFTVPSLDPASPRFDGLRYWRGPVWAPVNALIGMGLAECGRADKAARVRSDTARLIRETGFWEYFDPRDGRGAGGADFTWTAAVWLAWAREA